MSYWIVSSKHSRDYDTSGWDSKWTADNFLRSRKFYPSVREDEFQKGDKCILKVFGAKILLAILKLLILNGKMRTMTFGTP